MDLRFYSVSLVKIQPFHYRTGDWALQCILPSYGANVSLTYSRMKLSTWPLLQCCEEKNLCLNKPGIPKGADA